MGNRKLLFTAVSHRAGCCERARDSTVYGGWSTSAKHASKGAKSFFVHHTQQLAAAAKVGDAQIRGDANRGS